MVSRGKLCFQSQEPVSSSIPYPQNEANRPGSPSRKRQNEANGLGGRSQIPQNEANRPYDQPQNPQILPNLPNQRNLLNRANRTHPFSPQIRLHRKNSPSRVLWERRSRCRPAPRRQIVEDQAEERWIKSGSHGCLRRRNGCGPSPETTHSRGD